MKVVLFCGGLGTRIREYSENIPKPMIPIGHQPIVWHVMNYYSEYGHKDFVLCLGYKANTVKDYFINYRSRSYADCVVDGANIESIGPQPDENWRITMIDTGVWRNIGGRLWAVKDQLKDEEYFLANYSDGLTDVDLDDMIEKFKASGKIGCFLAVHPPVTYHLANLDQDGGVKEFITSDQSEIWINGGYFIFRKELFDYMKEGEELVVEPFKRLIDEGKLMAYRHEGFWRSMDTLRDRQVLEDMIEKGDMPWKVSEDISIRPRK
ncbi:MAG: sugar phosphate nucleotidyltransferase [Hyphomonadaceae bacterium]